MPKLNNFFDKTETVEKILTKKMHPQLVSIKKLEESKLQYRDIPQEDVEKLADLQSLQVFSRGKRLRAVRNDSMLCKGYDGCAGRVCSIQYKRLQQED